MSDPKNANPIDDKMDAKHPQTYAHQMNCYDCRPPTYKPPAGITLKSDWFDDKHGRG